ncbi:MAG TPA: glycosyltransferase [Candidatus Poseidoniales archaeon]|nr:glycosyltransferase [Candidatus Poseidoniales archaeon]
MTLENSKTLIVVPARGGSKGIPRKNLRLLGDEPLIAHILRVARGVQNARLVVSTDDGEIAEVARQYGAEVIMRPPELASDEATLDQTVVHVWECAQILHECQYEKVVTLQPTSPFTQQPTIETAIGMLEDVDSVLSVTDVRHLRWTEDEEGPKPLFSERVNRQWLPPTWSETGGVIACRSEILTTGSRIGGQVALLKVDERESLDIDTHMDWAVAESILATPRTAIRVIGDLEHGLGHVFRGLTLADSMHSKPLFITHSSSEMGADIIRSRHYECRSHDNLQELMDILIEKNVKVLINDVLDTDADEMEAIRNECGCLLANFEDMGSGSMVADVTFNALYEHPSPEANQLYGWRWFCLREEFIHNPLQDSEDDDCTRVLIAFGGTDPRELTIHVVNSIAEQSELVSKIALTVVVGPGNPNREKINKVVENISNQFWSTEVRHEVRRMSDLMRAADMAITSNGRTVFELAACHTPMIVICQNKRETTHTFTRKCGAAIDLGFSEEFPDTEFAEAFRVMALDASMRESMVKGLHEFELGNGTKRVLNEISERYRKKRQDT